MYVTFTSVVFLCEQSIPIYNSSPETVFFQRRLTDAASFDFALILFKFNITCEIQNFEWKPPLIIISIDLPFLIVTDHEVYSRTASPHWVITTNETVSKGKLQKPERLSEVSEKIALNNNFTLTERKKEETIKTRCRQLQLLLNKAQLFIRNVKTAEFGGIFYRRAAEEAQNRIFTINYSYSICSNRIGFGNVMEGVSC